MERRPNRDEGEHTELQRIGSLVKSLSYLIGLSFLAPFLLNKFSKAIDSDVVYSVEFYKLAH